VGEFEWTDLTADGVTALGKLYPRRRALRWKTPPRGLPPVLVLISDGATDVLKRPAKLMAEPWAKTVPWRRSATTPARTCAKVIGTSKCR
jgi:hypothetical protein